MRQVVLLLLEPDLGGCRFPRALADHAGHRQAGGADVGGDFFGAARGQRLARVLLPGQEE
jgi:hypothetical protein